MKRHIPKLIFLLFLICFFFIFFKFNLNKYFTYENINQVKKFILTFSILAPLVIIFLYIVFNLALVPTFYFSLFCGYLYGFLYGFLLGWFGMIIGMLSAFINSRYIFRNDFQKKFGNNKIVLFLERYANKYHGWAVIFFRIFFFIPYNFQNTAYGLTKIKLHTYIICSAIGILPITILFAYLGNLFAKNRIDAVSIKNIFLFIIIFISVFASIFFTSLLIRKKLKVSNNNLEN